MSRTEKFDMLRQRFRPLISLVYILLFGLALAAGQARAECGSGRWRVLPEFSVAGISDYAGHDGAATSFSTLSAMAELTLRCAGRPYHGGAFFNYRSSSNPAVDDNVNIGGYFRYNWSRWDATTWVFVNRAPQRPDAWLYATRLRYRIAGEHKVGVETMAPFDDAGAPMVMGGYYGSVTDALSVKLLAGRQVGGSVDTAVRLGLSWQIR